MPTLQIKQEFSPANHPQPYFRAEGGLFYCSFKAMASDCEVVLEGFDRAVAQGVCEGVVIETWRIESKFSRYRSDSVIQTINQGDVTVNIDAETHALFEFADQCYQISDGMFDITSGVLRKIWTFDGGSKVPSEFERESLLERIGWHRVQRSESSIMLPKGMELDLGGIGKEYAVDRALIIALQVICDRSTQSVLINLGGDLASSGPRVGGEPWVVGVESALRDQTAVASVELFGGGIATSGNANRFVVHEGRKLPHILNPKTAWPIEGAPAAISVAAPSCLHAGMLSTIAMLQGENANEFLVAQGVRYWIQA